jgi:hypothetical protein
MRLRARFLGWPRRRLAETYVRVGPTLGQAPSEEVTIPGKGRVKPVLPNAVSRRLKKGVAATPIFTSYFLELGQLLGVI